MPKDKDNPEWTKQDFTAARPACEVLPDLIGQTNADLLLKRRGRPPTPDRKQQLTLRLDPEIINYFKDQGRGYHSKINQALKDWIRQH